MLVESIDVQLDRKSIVPFKLTRSNSRMLLLRQLNVNNQVDNYANSLAIYQFINANEKENHETSSQIDKGRGKKAIRHLCAFENWHFSRFINA